LQAIAPEAVTKVTQVLAPKAKTSLSTRAVDKSVHGVSADASDHEETSPAATLVKKVPMAIFLYGSTG
jgi:hypothetical protein